MSCHRPAGYPSLASILRNDASHTMTRTTVDHAVTTRVMRVGGTFAEQGLRCLTRRSQTVIRLVVPGLSDHSSQFGDIVNVCEVVCPTPRFAHAPQLRDDWPQIRPTVVLALPSPPSSYSSPRSLPLCAPFSAQSSPLLAAHTCHSDSPFLSICNTRPTFSFWDTRDSLHYITRTLIALFLCV